MPMGLVKIKRWIPEDGNHLKQSSKSTIDELVQEDRIVSGADSGNDSDAPELAEVGYEFVMVGDQLCSVPYEIYDLPDLKEILSLETWNSCLTDEERFSLSAHLPDMDQQMFFLTMNDLLSGKDMFFGSPLAELFKRLKGGFYPPKVTRYREGLQFLQRRAYYHSLRLYHENMAQTFSDMKRAWSNCRPSISVKERICIWNALKKQKAENLSSNGNVKEILGPSVKKKKYMNSIEENNHVFTPSVAKEMELTVPKTKAKGVLKIKPLGMNSMQNHMAKAVSIDTWALCRPSPKGVLKIKPRGTPLCQQDQRIAKSMPQESTPLAEVSSLQISRFSPLIQSTCGWDAEKHVEEPPLLYQTSGRKAYKNPELSDCIIGRQRVKFLNSTTKFSRNFQSSTGKVKSDKDPIFNAVADLQEINGRSLKGRYGFLKNSQNGRRYDRERENLWQNLSRKNGEVCQNFTESNPFAAEYHRGKQPMMLMHDQHVPVYPGITEAVSRIPDGSIEEHHIFTDSLDRLKSRNGDGYGVGLGKPFHEPVVSEGLRDTQKMPITYKRRKASMKLGMPDLVNPQTMGVDFGSRIPKDKNRPLRENVKGVKIKFKN